MAPARRLDKALAQSICLASPGVAIVTADSSLSDPAVEAIMTNAMKDAKAPKSAGE